MRLANWQAYALAMRVGSFRWPDSRASPGWVEEGLSYAKHSLLTPETAIALAIDLVTTLNTQRLLPLSGEKQAR